MENNVKQVELHNIASRLTSEDMQSDENSLLGFCYPTHGFNAPPIVLRFLWQFPRTNKKTKIFLLNTRAGMKMSKLFTPGFNTSCYNSSVKRLPHCWLSTAGYAFELDIHTPWIETESD